MLDPGAFTPTYSRPAEHVCLWIDRQLASEERISRAEPRRRKDRELARVELTSLLRSPPDRGG